MNSNNLQMIKKTSNSTKLGTRPEQRALNDKIECLPGCEGYHELDTDKQAEGILEVMLDGFGFIRGTNYLSSANDVYISPSLIKKYELRTGDFLSGIKGPKSNKDKFSALQYINSVNGISLHSLQKRRKFENLTPVFPNKKICLDSNSNDRTLRMIDLFAPIGKGQRGMIVSAPKSGKTTIIKKIAAAISNNSSMHLIIVLIDERPEEVTDFKETIIGPNVEVAYSTFDELPENHRKVSEMALERAKRLAEQHKDVVILLDGITRLTRAYNLSVQPSGRTLTGGLDPAALHLAKRFFGAARNIKEGGSLTILATALIETGSRMDDVIFEEFKGTGNMELILDTKLSEKRIFPAVDCIRSGTRRDDLLLREQESAVANFLRRGEKMHVNEISEKIIRYFIQTADNNELVHLVLNNSKVMSQYKNKK